MSRADVVVFEPAEYAEHAAALLAELMGQAIAARGQCSVALAGGSTPIPVYRALVRQPVSWDRLHVFFGDERAVPLDHPESNYGAAREALLRHVPIPPGQVHPMAADRADRAGAAAEYDRLLPAALDLLVLGMGGDGHTASLFPGSPALAERARRVVPVVGPKPPPERLTITPAVIGAARSVVFLVTGRDKAAVVERVLNGPVDVDALPAQLGREGRWVLDPDAAGQLPAGMRR